MMDDSAMDVARITLRLSVAKKTALAILLPTTAAPRAEREIGCSNLRILLVNVWLPCRCWQGGVF